MAMRSMVTVQKDTDYTIHSGPYLTAWPRYL